MAKSSDVRDEDCIMQSSEENSEPPVITISSETSTPVRGKRRRLDSGRYKKTGGRPRKTDEPAEPLRKVAGKKTKKVGQPLVYDHPMDNAERKRRSRAYLKYGVKVNPSIRITPQLHGGLAALVKQEKSPVTIKKEKRGTEEAEGIDESKHSFPDCIN